jgi:hypothetical protein
VLKGRPSLEEAHPLPSCFKPHAYFNYGPRFSHCEEQSTKNGPLSRLFGLVFSRKRRTFPDPARTTVQAPHKGSPPLPLGEGRGEGGASLEMTARETRSTTRTRTLIFPAAARMFWASASCRSPTTDGELAQDGRGMI